MLIVNSSSKVTSVNHISLTNQILLIVNQNFSPLIRWLFKALIVTFYHFLGFIFYLIKQWFSSYSDKKVTNCYFIVRKSNRSLLFPAKKLHFTYISHLSLENSSLFWRKYYESLLFVRNVSYMVTYLYKKKLKVITFPPKRFQIAPLACKTCITFSYKKNYESSLFLTEKLEIVTFL